MQNFQREITRLPTAPVTNCQTQHSIYLTFATMITITYNEIYDKAFELASFEAGRGVQDEALFNVIVLNERDRAFINSFADQATESLCSLLSFCLDDWEVGSGISFTFRTTCSLSATTKANRVKTQLIDAIVSLVMSKWLDNKLPDRAKSYASMFTDMAGAIVSSVKRVKPKLA